MGFSFRNSCPISTSPTHHQQLQNNHKTNNSLTHINQKKKLKKKKKNNMSSACSFNTFIQVCKMANPTITAKEIVALWQQTPWASARNKGEEEDTDSDMDTDSDEEDEDTDSEDEDTDSEDEDTDSEDEDTDSEDSDSDSDSDSEEEEEELTFEDFYLKLVNEEGFDEPYHSDNYGSYDEARAAARKDARILYEKKKAEEDTRRPSMDMEKFDKDLGNILKKIEHTDAFKNLGNMLVECGLYA